MPGSRAAAEGASPCPHGIPPRPAGSGRLARHGPGRGRPGAVRLALAALLGGVLAACTPTEEAAPPVRIDVVDAQAAARLVDGALALGLTRRDPAGLVVPGLAQSWRVSEDGLSIVFRLREARFANGSRVTAADAVATLEAARRRRTHPLRELLAGIASVAAPLEDVVELRLTTPQPELLELLADPSLGILPRGIGSLADSGLGAFRLAAGPEDGPVRLERNPVHAGGAAAAGELEVAVRAPAEALDRFQRRLVDVVTGGGVEGFPGVRVTAPRETLRLEPSRAVLLLLVNHRRAPLDDVRVRRALDRTADRGALARLVFGTEAAAPVAGIAPRSLPAFALAPEPDWAAVPPEDRQAEAVRLLAEAGIGPEPERRRRLVVGIGRSAEEGRMMSRLAAGWAPLGIDLVAAPLPDEAAILRALRKDELDLALVTRRTPHDSPLPFLLPLRCRENPGGVCVEEADRLLAGSWKAATLAERMRALAEAERLWSEEVAVISLFQPLAWSLVQPGIEGFETNPAGARSLLRLSRAEERRLVR